MRAEVFLLSYPNQRFRGRVQGVGWALYQDNGASVAGLPQVEPTLNWVRLSQRFPVRITLEDRDPERPFRMGATAVVTVQGAHESMARDSRAERRAKAASRLHSRRSGCGSTMPSLALTQQLASNPHRVRTSAADGAHRGDWRRPDRRVTHRRADRRVRPVVDCLGARGDDGSCEGASD